MKPQLNIRTQRHGAHRDHCCRFAGAIGCRHGNWERGECSRYLARYVANWRWDLAMYLYYVRIEVFEDSRSIGLAEYDATLGGLNLGKFGSTEGKLRPLVDQLFARP
jgi:hypothetical protein